MRYLVLLTLIGFTGLTLTYHDAAYGAYMPLPPQELLENSEMILVGNLTSVNVTEIVETMGTKNPQNYTATIDEYKVKVEEYLKNSLELDEVTVVSELGRSAGFEAGDRVLLYVKEQNDILTYYHESFVLPKYCDARKVLEEPRIVDPFVRMQNGVQKDQEFTADIPIQFRYQKDMRTLAGKGFDVRVTIVKEVENDSEIVYDQIIHTESKSCEWIASAEWEITPDEGNYRMSVGIKEEGDTSYSLNTGPFYVNSGKTINLSPLKQFKSGIPIDEIQCMKEMVLITKSSDGFPACVKRETAQKLVERGWSAGMIVHLDSNKKESIIVDVIIPQGSADPTAGKNYEPSVIKIVLGVNNTVRWINDDGVSSTIVSDHAYGSHRFGSPRLDPGDWWTYTFTKSGIYDYHNQPHPWKDGKVIVLVENEDSARVDCNSIDGKIEAQCLRDSFEMCMPAISHSVIYTIEGDPTYLQAAITENCRIDVRLDVSEDRFGGDKDIYDYVCYGVSLHKEHAWKIDECDEDVMFQINYDAHEWKSHQKCTDIGGKWNNTFHNCVGVDESQCLKSGGTVSCMSYEQMGHSRDVCQLVCEFEPTADRK